MEVHIHRHILLLFFVIFSCSLFSSQAFKFYVGGKDGWVLNPSENYTHWTERNRFQVNDTLVFKYKKGSDSVLVVNKDDYYNCNTTNPIKKLEEGDSEYKVEKSGPFFFISGKKQNCEKGQKLLVVVLSVKHNSTIKPHPPISSPTQSPTHPPSKTPVSAPTPARYEPEGSPFASPPAPPSSESPSSEANSPSNSPSSSPTSSQRPSPKSPAPGNQIAPTPASSAWAVTPSYVLLGSVTLLLSGAF
ncbi:early nodulin-like protein 2 [Fagus crenata]